MILIKFYRTLPPHPNVVFISFKFLSCTNKSFIGAVYWSHTFSRSTCDSVTILCRRLNGWVFAQGKTWFWFCQKILVGNCKRYLPINLNITLKVLLGIRHLHQYRFIHRDIAGNLLYSMNYITDISLYQSSSQCLGEFLSTIPILIYSIQLSKDLEPKVTGTNHFCSTKLLLKDFGLSKKIAENKSHHSTAGGFGPIVSIFFYHSFILISLISEEMDEVRLKKKFIDLNIKITTSILLSPENMRYKQFSA